MTYKGLTLSTIRSGKGECIHVGFGNNHLIIDSGPALAAREFRKLCESILLNGESINTLIITHYDGDHIGGILKVGDLGFHSIYFNAYFQNCSGLSYAGLHLFGKKIYPYR